MNEKQYNYLFYLSVILILGIFLFPRIGAHLRIEDIITPIIVLVTIDPIVLSLWKQMPYRIGINPVLFYISYLFYITIMNIIAGEIPWQAIIVCGKEVQYLYIYVLICYILKHKEKYYFQVSRLLTLLILIGTLYGVYSVIFDVRGYYGIGYFNEHNSPSLSGLMYFNISVLASLFYIIHRNKFFLYVVFGAIVSAFNVGSRITVVILVCFYLLYILNYKLYHFFYKSFFVIFLFVIFSVVIIFKNDLYNTFYFNNFSNRIIRAAITRAATILKPYETGKSSRFEPWKNLITKSIQSETGLGSLYWPFFGHGRGGSHAYRKGRFFLGLAGDSQYLVNLYEIGLIGTFIFFYMLFSFYRVIPFYLKRFYLIYLISYLIGGITMEIWQLSKGGQMFYIITAILVAFPNNEATSKSHMPLF
jgi:hypothetical protein